MIEIGENGILRKKTSNQFHGIKNRRIWTWFRGEIKIRSGEKFRNVEIANLDEIWQIWNVNPKITKIKHDRKIIKVKLLPLNLFSDRNVAIKPINRDEH